MLSSTWEREQKKQTPTTNKPLATTRCVFSSRVLQDAPLWNVVRSEPRDLTAYLQKHISEPRGCTGGFPAHQRCTSNRGLWAARTSCRENTSRSAPLKEALIFYKDAMTASLSDAFETRGSGRLGRGWGDEQEGKSAEIIAVLLLWPLHARTTKLLLCFRIGVCLKANKKTAETKYPFISKKLGLCYYVYSHNDFKPCRFQSTKLGPMSHLENLFFLFYAKALTTKTQARVSTI